MAGQQARALRGFVAELFQFLAAELVQGEVAVADWENSAVAQRGVSKSGVLLQEPKGIDSLYPSFFPQRFLERTTKLQKNLLSL